jgi:hypothetical protein
MDFKELLYGVFDGLIQIYQDINIGGEDVDYFLPEWNIVIFIGDMNNSYSANEVRRKIIKDRILEYGGDDYHVEFIHVMKGNELQTIQQILKISTHEMYWWPLGHIDHSEWVSTLGGKE